MAGITPCLHRSASYSFTEHSVELDANKEGDSTTATDSTVESESASNRGNGHEATTDPTQLGQEERREIPRNKQYGSGDNPVFNRAIGQPSAANTEPAELLYCVEGASLAGQESAQEQFAGDVGCSDYLSGYGRGHAITTRQNYLPWKEPPRETSSTGSKIKPCPEKISFYCLTQGCIQRGSANLQLHRGRNETISRWKFGSEIKYSIDYDSFLSKGRTMDDADYALKSLQVALEVWNCHNIGVTFKFVEPDTSPIAFQLGFEHEPLHIPFDVRSSVLASSFFPVHQPWDRKLHVFAASFSTSLRPHMTRIFLHESAHILGGRHENADTAEQDDPSVQLGKPNEQSVLVTNCHPSDISLHWKDIKWFSNFMRFPEGHRIDNFPICSISP
ncbi:hypothetical protein GGR58DRAFT_69033 [Xylaria digitata]|nr:hypothetical protein GGR58DRAFT_69033 [Xylaria digitata]